MADGDTVRVRYTGKHTNGASIRLPDGSERVVKPGEILAAPAGPFADGLLAQVDSWKPSGAAAKEVAEQVAETLPAPDAAQGG